MSRQRPEAAPYYALTKAMGKGRPFADYTRATHALKEQRARRNPTPATRTNPGPRIGKKTLIAGAALAAVLLYEHRRRVAPTTATTATAGTPAVPGI